MDGLPRYEVDVGALVRQHDARVVEKARAKAVRRHERAVARRERVLLRARRAVPRHLLLGGAATAVVVLASGWEDWVFGPVATVSAVVLVRAVTVLRHPPPLPEPPVLLTAPPAPPAGSSAAPAVLRLDRVREQLDRLAPLVGPSGREAAADALRAAAEAETALRWQAARLAAVEPHRGAEPALLAALVEGVACQERLVAALADLVAASDPRSPAGGLQDAADALHGLADGLRQVR